MPESGRQAQQEERKHNNHSPLLITRQLKPRAPNPAPRRRCALFFASIHDSAPLSLTPLRGWLIDSNHPGVSPQAIDLQAFSLRKKHAESVQLRSPGQRPGVKAASTKHEVDLPPHYCVAMFTSLLGTMITLQIVLPSVNFFVWLSEITFASSSLESMFAGTTSLPRTFPLTWITISTF